MKIISHDTFSFANLYLKDRFTFCYCPLEHKLNSFKYIFMHLSTQIV